MNIEQLKKLRKMNVAVLKLAQKELITRGTILVARETFQKIIKDKIYVVEKLIKGEWGEITRLVISSSFDLETKEDFPIETAQLVYFRLPTEEEYKKFSMCQNFWFDIEKIKQKTHELGRLITKGMYEV